MKKWEQILAELEKTCPKSKIEDIKSVKGIIEKMAKTWFFLENYWKYSFDLMIKIGKSNLNSIKNRFDVQL